MDDASFLHEGFYDLLLTEARKAALERLDTSRWRAVYDSAPEGEGLLLALSSHLSVEILNFLRARCGDVPPDRWLPQLRAVLCDESFRSMLHGLLLPAPIESKDGAQGKGEPRRSV